MNYETAKNVLLQHNHRHPQLDAAASYIAADVQHCQRLADEEGLAIKADPLWNLVEIDYPDGLSILSLITAVH